MEVSDVVIKGSSFKAKFSINLSKPFDEYSSKYVINEVEVFQVRVMGMVSSDSRGNVVKNNSLVFCKMCKMPKTAVYNIYLTSAELGIKNKVIKSDITSWTLVYENNAAQVSFVMEALLIRATVTTDVESLLDESELVDFELRGIDGGVRVHRAILAAASPVLRRMLSGEWRETAQGHVDLPNVSVATLEEFKRFIYDNANVYCVSHLKQLILLANLYMIPVIEQDCVGRLVAEMTAENATDLLEFAIQHKLKRLMYGVLECVKSGALCLKLMQQHDKSLENNEEKSNE